MTNAIIFDFDGVIINSLEVQRKAFYDSFRKVSNGSLPSFEEYVSHSGDSIKNIFIKMGLPLEMIEPYCEISRKNIGFIEVVDNIESILIDINKRGWKCGLCTGKDRERTLEILALYNLQSYFEAIVCSNDVNHPKPHPESLLLVIQQLNCSLENSVMIGDGKNDIICAKDSGVKSIAVSWGHSTLSDLKTVYPDYIAYSVTELHQHIINLFSYTNKEECLLSI